MSLLHQVQATWEGVHTVDKYPKWFGGGSDDDDDDAPRQHPSQVTDPSARLYS